MGWDRFLAGALSGNDFGKVLHIQYTPCRHLSELGTGHRAVIFCGWGGNGGCRISYGRAEWRSIGLVDVA